MWVPGVALVPILGSTVLAHRYKLSNNLESPTVHIRQYSVSSTICVVLYANKTLGACSPNRKCSLLGHPSRPTNVVHNLAAPGIPPQPDPRAYLGSHLPYVNTP